MPPYVFRPAVPADLLLLHTWRGRPHVVRWWGPTDAEDPAGALANPHVRAWIVSFGDRPFAYAQDYDPHAWADHPFAHLPPRSRGVDHHIGEPDMLDRGHGTALIRQHCDLLFDEGAPAIGADPHPDNARALRAYGKAGLAPVTGPVDTIWGRAILMERSRSGAAAAR